MSDSISEAEAWGILDDLAKEAKRELGHRLVCLTAFGSLVNGDYTPGFSDIDQVLVVRPGPDRESNMEAAKRAVTSLNRRPGELRDRLHEGYVLCRDAIWNLDADSDVGLVLRDVVDLALHGKTLAGEHIWPGVRRPSNEELREAVVYGVFWIPERLPNLKSLLNCIFAVGGARYYCSTGTMTWTKRELWEKYVSRPDLPFGNLVAEAEALRKGGSLPPAESATELARLQPQYIEFLRETRAWMTASGLNRLHAVRTKVPGLVGDAPPVSRFFS